MCIIRYCKVVHVIIHEAKGRYAFCSYLYNYFYSNIQFFQPKRITIKLVKVIENEIYNELFEIYKGTEKVVLVKFLEGIPFSGSYFFQWKASLLGETIFFFAETISSSGGHSFQWKPSLLAEAIPFGGNHSFQWKPFDSVEVAPFS